MSQAVTLSCDPGTLPAGASCSFVPSTIIPRSSGNASRLTVNVPTSIHYGVFNVTVNGTPSTTVPTVFGLVVAAKVAMNPTSTASTSDTIGKTITVEVNITGAPPFGGFIVGILFNEAVLQFQAMDYSRNVFGSDYFPLQGCLDAHDIPGIPGCSDKTYEAAGIVSLELSTNTGNNYVANGTLFRLAFTVVATGFSSLHFSHLEVDSEPNGIALQTTGYDGYFTNEYCGGGNLCKPPLVSFTPPSKPVVGRPATFTGTGLSQNLSGNITLYEWNWRSFADVHYFNSTAAGDRGSSTNITLAFPQIGQHIVTLGAVDNFGATAYYTLSIALIRVWTDLGIASLLIDSTVGVIPGTVIHITTSAFNNGVNPENSTLRLSINNQNVNTQPVVNLQPNLLATISYDWNTAGLTPRVYRVDVALDEVRNGTTGQLLENDTVILQGRLVDPNNARVAFVQLITSLPSGFGLFLGLNLPETLGLGIVLVAAAGFVFGLVKKARAPPPEPL